MKRKKQRYIGSVRFYKNMILLAVIIFILLPTIFAFIYKGRYLGLKKQLEEAGGLTVTAGQDEAPQEKASAQEETQEKQKETQSAGEQTAATGQEKSEPKETKPRIIYINGQNGETIAMVIEDQ